MKRNLILVFFIIIIFSAVRCHDKRSNNINLSQASTFNRKTHTYSLKTKLDITNRFGFSIESDEWLATTKNADEIEGIFKTQRLKADDICRRYQ